MVGPSVLRVIRKFAVQVSPLQVVALTFPRLGPLKSWSFVKVLEVAVAPPPVELRVIL